MRFLYRVLCAIALPFALLRLVWRARRQPEYLQHVRERFGAGPKPRSQGAIWVHAVSVGETRAAEPLIRALQQQHPGIALLLTCTTPTGRATAAQLFGVSVEQAYIPYDLPFAVGRFLARHRPRIGLLMETELWPEIILQCRQRGITLHVVNGRLSARSAQRYRKGGEFIKEVMQALHCVEAQSEADAQRYRELGASDVHVCGNLKFDRAATPADHALAATFRQRFAGRRAILVASTREGEEELLLDAWQRCARSDLLLVIVPRHPQRFDAIAARMTQRGLNWQRRSDNAPLGASTQIWLGDSMGEMYAYHDACDVSLIGGSFAELGGQNLLEACTVGRPVIVGPHMFNFAEATRLALGAGAAIQVASVDEAMHTALALLEDDVRRHQIGERGLALMREHQGATGRVLARLNL